MSYKYAYNTRDIKFILKEWLPIEEVLAYDRYKEYWGKDDLDVVIDQVRQIAEEVIAPTAEDGETFGVRFENGQAYIPPSFHKVYHFLQEQGWGTSNFGHHTEGALPLTVINLLIEIMSAANPAFMPYLNTGQGVVDIIQEYASEDVQERFLPKLLDGTWGGTMSITEPTSGSDAGDLLSRAIPTDDPRIYNIIGQKIFITCGDRDDVENIIHMYLARVQGAAAGSRGLSLFVVPKYWVNDDGSYSPNDVQCIGVEHKMGLKGSSTAQLVVGENKSCRGWIVGNPPDENGTGLGMMQMFNMMNEARLDTGRLSTAVTANAYWNAKDYGKERVQGRPLTNPKAGRVTINQHEDVKRMYMMSKATTEACRALLSKCYYYSDVKNYDSDPARRKWAQSKLDVLTPLCKAYPSDEGWTLIGESLQSYGGYGYCEEYPAANSARDVKIWSIWEGTNFIQSMDLIGRKWTQAKGEHFASMLKEVEDFIGANKGNWEGWELELEHLEKALNAYRGIQMTVMGFMKSGNAGLMALYARRILTTTAQTYCSYLLLDQARIADKRMAELGEDHYDYTYYLGKTLSARYYLRSIVPNVWYTADLIKIADRTAIDAPVEIFDF